ncbi:GlxA family transcriptional regulator [Streptomyces sp. NPDC001260]|uniref:Helix-turn-helix domain-containing protein n=1 Tax=Streptomyces gilvifuscus TaxID=1550617 RepID=A0ABT5G2F2_9ACTN|nr:MULTISPECIES: helix-turn-helix domain-containing protein [Streptomyces]MBK3647555.1 helix-turn-helix domain-containing protein [Streptomyces sp. MBT33]MDC2958811.1 helix-turn-helix domain-containing protein [Streptomyces gilvifuscus]
MASAPDAPAHRVALLAFPGIRAFDVSVITEVWGTDRTDRGAPAFDLRRVATDSTTPIPMRGGMALLPDRTLDWLAEADLIVVPGLDDHLTPAPAPVLDALRHAHARGTTIAALCGGAFTLAQAGLLDGRRAITHWNLVDLLRAHHPHVTVVPDALFIEDDNIWTAAGTAAGIDLCLHLVRRSHGAEAAATIARSMVTAPFRTGTQAQFIEHPTPRADRDADTLAAVREHALRHLHEPLTVADLAAHAGMSPRSFARHFTAETGTTPLRWLLDQRIAAAQKLLERTDLPMPEVARRAGFGSEVTMRQHFASRLATSPRAYRTAFSTTPASASAPASGTAGSNPIAR